MMKRVLGIFGKEFSVDFNVIMWWGKISVAVKIYVQITNSVESVSRWQIV